MTEAEPVYEGPLGSTGRPGSRKPLVSQAQLICVCLVIGIGALITGAPALVLGPGSFRCDRSMVLPTMPAPPPVPPPPKRLKLPWEPVLTKEELRRGETYYGSGGRLNRLANKLLAGKPIKVYTLGGSVTGGGGASRKGGSYVDLFFSFIQQAFPHRQACPAGRCGVLCPGDHVFVNKAIAASTAFLYATCLKHHVPEVGCRTRQQHMCLRMAGGASSCRLAPPRHGPDPVPPFLLSVMLGRYHMLQDVDLVTLEFSVNERSEAQFTSPERRNFEQLLRRLLQYPSRPAIIMLHHYAWWESPGDGLDRGVFYHQPEGQLTELAHYYDIPTLSIRAAAYHLMAANIDRFRVDKVPMAGRLHRYLADNGTVIMGTIPVSHPAEGLDPFFLVDGMHPGNLGHQALAELLAQPLVRAVWEAEAGEAVYTADRREEFRPVVKNSSGFEYLPERPKAEDFMHQKWGWRGTEPGAWAELELDTRPEEEGAGGDTVVWLAHLRSYRGMGTALIECVSGCTCAPAKLDGTWQRRASLFWMTRFIVTQHRRCRVRVTVLDEAGEFPQEGHKVTLVAVMVAHLDLAQSGTLANVQELQNMRRKRRRRRKKKK
ncbi:hypothetical protein CHLNCDRAFT_142315 [Chlorella variabilis]|uniref:SGNH hydrolase-type esterase domain-containing protein n=1 Tax=Chlorella variabilis TaxID=554065 RepID=E1Z8A2_CHLVA|nr:hypothetical protein CHLNCDRAFT_142315 [Chlorella variabilis]EFN58310.1 hypothetical protein CHLNCDRAFT_142315 [Chlorella variabilis]|eukprot:XP_005850412.1 hypothetical protein CHLNCDRAFT_142315 [Chlorella variabilis]